MKLRELVNTLHGNLPVGELISASAQYCPGVHRVGAEEPRGQ